MPLDDSKPLKPLRAIRYKCLDCSSGSIAEVRGCPVTRCPLHPFRLGHWPKDRAELTGEFSRGL